MATPVVDTWTEWRILPSPVVAEEDYPITQNVAGFISNVKPIKVLPSEDEIGVLDVMIAFFDAGGNLITNDTGAKVTIQVIELVELPPDHTPGGLVALPFLLAIGDEHEFEVKDAVPSGLKRRGLWHRYDQAVGFPSKYGVVVSDISGAPVFDKLGIFARFA